MTESSQFPLSLTEKERDAVYPGNSVPKSRLEFESAGTGAAPIPVINMLAESFVTSFPEATSTPVKVPIDGGLNDKVTGYNVCLGIGTGPDDGVAVNVPAGAAVTRSRF